MLFNRRDNAAAERFWSPGFIQHSARIAPDREGLFKFISAICTKEELLMSVKGDVIAQYLGHGDPALADYYPAWLDNMADDATVEGSLLDGAVQGAEAVRSIVVAIRSLYDRQEHKFAGPCGENGFLEDYVAEVRGEPIGCVALVTRNAAGQTQHVVAGTGHAVRCCSCPACCARNSPVPPLPSTSSRTSEVSW